MNTEEEERYVAQYLDCIYWVAFKSALANLSSLCYTTIIMGLWAFLCAPTERE